MAEQYFLASRMASYITFQKLEKVKMPNGSWGEPEWKDAFKTWAEVLTIGGEEGRMAAAESSAVRYRITLRYRNDITPDMRVIPEDGTKVNIKSIRDINGRRVYMEINGESKQGAV